MAERIDQEKAAAWLNRQWQGEKLCPICRNNKWAIGDTAVEVREFNRGAFTVGGPVYPMFVVTCQVCGYTLLFNALVARLIESPPATAPRASKAGEPPAESSEKTKAAQEGSTGA